MSKVISQETFDDVLKENVVDFAMSPDEAREETIKQFEAQGINLTNIIKNLAINNETGKPLLNESIDKIKAHLSDQKLDEAQLRVCLDILDEECQKSIAHRVLAGKNGAHSSLITLLEQELSSKKPSKELMIKCLKALNSITNKQPDLFDAESLALILSLLKSEQDDDILCLTLQWLQKASVMHETNRQSIVSAGIAEHLRPSVTPKTSVEVLRELLAVFRCLVLDDDVRVEFGNAHEHARRIAKEYIVDLTKMLGEVEDLNLLADLLLTIGTLAVRHEFCTAIEEAGGLNYIFDAMKKNPDSERLNREALKLLRALAGHDIVKVKIVEQGVPAIIKDLLQIHQNNDQVAANALACVSTLTLRVKNNSTAFFEVGIAEIIVETIRAHPKNKIVQRNGAWAIRNMVSRSREQCETWLSHGIDELLNAAMAEHTSVQQDIKAALRDLGCEVELKEEWTGKAEKKIFN